MTSRRASGSFLLVYCVFLGSFRLPAVQGSNGTVLPSQSGLELIQQSPINPVEGSFILLDSRMVVVFDGGVPCLECEIVVLSPNSSSTGEPNGHFANMTMDLVDTIDVFTYQQILDGKVAFVFDTLGKPLQYVQNVEVRNGDLTADAVLNISAVPLKISASLHLSEGADCIQTLDLLTDLDLSIVLPIAAFNVVVTDNRGRLSEVTVHVIRPLSYGTLQLSGSNQLLPTNFSYTLFLEEQVVYKASGKSIQQFSDSFDVQFTIGHGQSEVVTIILCIDPLPYPVVTHVRTLTVHLNGREAFSPEFLLATQTRQLDTNVTFLWFEVVSTPLYGLILDESMSQAVTSLQVFTQNDLDLGKIIYVNKRKNKEGNMTDMFQFRLRNQYYQPDTQYTAWIKLKENSIEVVNEGFNVSEGETHLITKDELFAFAPNGYEITTYILTQPKEGNLLVKRSNAEPLVTSPPYFSLEDIEMGYLSYHHNKLKESNMDEFSFLFVAKKEGYQTLDFPGLYNITINLVNDNPPVESTNKLLVVVEGSSQAITTDNLMFEDDDYGYVNGNLKYVLKYTLFEGELCLRGNCSNSNPFSWYQRDMQGDLVYKHTNLGRNSPSDIVLFSVFDDEIENGGFEVSSQIFLISITPVLPVRIGTLPLIVLENEKARLLPTNLNFTSKGSVKPQEYKYTVTQQPRRGSLYNTNTENTANSFTQLDINNGYIEYRHDGSNDLSDDFKVRLGVRSFVPKEYTVQIIIIPLNDDVPRLTVNKEIFVDSMNLVHFNRSHLMIEDTDTPEPQLLSYIIQSAVKYGKLEMRLDVNIELYIPLLVGYSFTQADINNENIRYTHTNSEGFEDSFSFQIFDTVNRVKTSENASIYILPEIVPVIVGGVTVHEGGNVTLDSRSILIQHPYFARTNGKVVILQKVKHGYLTINGVTCQGSSNCDFHTNDLARKKIKYVHSGGEDKKDHFRFFIEWPDLPRTNFVNLTITILPVNDQHPMIVNNTGLTVWATEVVTVTPSQLLTTDIDSPHESLVYQFDLTPEQLLDGHFSRRGKLEQTNNTFTQEDINNGLIVYVDTHTYDGDRQLRFTVSDGVFQNSSVFTVTARVVTLTTVAKNSLSVHMGGSVNLTNEELSHGTNNKDIDSSQIWYHFSKGFSYGHLIGSNGKEKRAFTQADVDSGLLSYRHTGIDVWEPRDIAKVTVYARLALENISISLGVNIDLLNESDPLAMNKPLFLIEGDLLCINDTHLDGRNIRYTTWRDNRNNNLTLENTLLRYAVTTPPRYGQLLLNGSAALSFSHQDLVTGNVCYRSDGSENSKDEFSFDVIVSSPSEELNRISDVMHLHITLVNDELPVLETKSPRKSVVSGFWYEIKSEDLRVTDKDSPPDNITFTVRESSPDSALRLGDRMNVLMFTQADIDRGDVMLLSNTTGNTSFKFVYSDGIHSSEPATFSVTSEEHVLRFLVQNPLLEFYQTEKDAVVTSAIVNSTTNGYRYQTQYLITERPRYGEIIVNGEVSDSFSQIDIDSDAVRYRLSKLESSEDQLKLSVSNLKANELTFTLRVVITPMGIINAGYTLPPKMLVQVPAGVINLAKLYEDYREININITSKLQYGYLVSKYPNTDVGSTRISSFDYDDLKNGFVHYRWKQRTGLVAGDNYTEVITGVVMIDGLAPGQFTLLLTVQAPGEAVMSLSSTPVLTSPAATNTGVTEPETGTDDPSQFDYSLYVPMIGLIIVVLVACIAVVGFCCSQSGHIKQKLHHKSPVNFSPTQKSMSRRMSPSRPPHSPVPTGGFDPEYSDSESSSTPDVMMMQTRTAQQPMTTISASHTYLPHSQHSYDPGMSGYSTLTSMQARQSPTQLRHQESPTGGNYPPNATYNMFMRGNEMRSSSPVRRVSPTRRNTRPYASMTKVSGKGRSSPIKGLREYPAPSPLHALQSRPHIRDSSSSLGYDTSSMTQESLRLPSVSTPTPSNLESLINQESISELYRKAPPVLQSPQYWV